MRTLLSKVIIVSLLIFFFQVCPVSAQVSPAIPSPTPLPNGVQTEGEWLVDPEVTFAGKAASRAQLFLSWVLDDPTWSRFNQTENPFVPFWGTIRNIVYAFFGLFVLVTAFVLIVSRGKNLTFLQFVPRFVGMVLLVTFSFAILEFLYQIVDIIQNFFLQINGSQIQGSDIIQIGYDYDNFVGYRRAGPLYDESTFISVLLVKATSITFYIMGGILLVRKIILWLFIAVSPIFPLLLLYAPVRNVAKIWTGELFRWLFYAPLFAIFLFGLVSFWKQAIPLQFTFNEQALFPTSTNLLVGGPGITVSTTANVNSTNLYALYLVALLMLWVVMVLPFILLKIFLDYANTLDNSSIVKQIIATSTSVFNKSPIAPLSPSATPSPSGIARVIPFANKFFARNTLVDTIPLEPPSSTAGGGIARPIPQATWEPATVSSETPRVAGVVRSLQQEESEPFSVSSNVPRTSGIARPIPQATWEPATVSSETPRAYGIARPLPQGAIKESPVGIDTPRPIGMTQAMPVPRTREELSAMPDEAPRTIGISRQIPRDVQEPSFILRTMQRPTGVEQTSTQTKKTTFPINTTVPRVEPRMKSRGFLTSDQTTILKAAQLAIPTLRDIASYEIGMVSNNTNATTEVNRAQTILEKVANPQTISNIVERQHYTTLRDTLRQEKERGNEVASAVLTATHTVSQVPVFLEHTTLNERSILQRIANPALAASQETHQYSEIHNHLTQAVRNGDPVAVSVSSVVSNTTQVEPSEKTIVEMKEKLIQAKAAGNPIASEILGVLEAPEKTPQIQQATLPETNRIQSVSLDDYEAVKKMWHENYQTIEIPESNGIQADRKEWIRNEIHQVDQAVNLLSSPDKQKVQEGMSMVSKILPFLLIGGFSQQEVVAYLKAKQEAGKQTLSELENKQDEENTLLDRTTEQKEEEKHMAAEEEAPQDLPNNVPDSGEQQPSV